MHKLNHLAILKKRSKCMVHQGCRSEGSRSHGSQPASESDFGCSSLLLGRISRVKNQHLVDLFSEKPYWLKSIFCFFVDFLLLSAPGSYNSGLR